jgi:hypothetical protein
MSTATTALPVPMAIRQRRRAVMRFLSVAWARSQSACKGSKRRPSSLRLMIRSKAF